MEKTLRLLESFSARGSDGATYKVHAYEHLARLDAVPDTTGQWESTGVSEYKLADGRPVLVGRDGSMSVANSDLTLQRQAA